MSGKPYHTIVELNDVGVPQGPGLAWRACSFGLATMAAVCAIIATSQLFPVQLWASTATGSRTMQTGLVVPQMTTSFRVPMAAQVQGAAPVDTSEVYSVIPQRTSSAKAAFGFGGAFIFLSAALLLGRQLLAPQQEAQAMFATAGEKDSGIFTFTNLSANPGSRKRKTRKGRGHAAGQGATCGFGTRGQKSRKGRSVRVGFEGGQTPLYRSTPKLRGRPLGPGHKRTIYDIVSITTLAGAAEGSTIELKDESGAKPILFKVGGLKPNAEVELPKNLTVKAHAFTTAARGAIEAAGGKCITIDKYSRELDAKGRVVKAEPEKVAMLSVSGEVAIEIDDEDYEDEDEALNEVPSDIAMFSTTAMRTPKVGKYKDPTPKCKNVPEPKKDIVTVVHELLKGSFLVFGFPTEGFTMAQFTKLRKTLPAGAKVMVVKNTLFRMAARGTGFECLDPITMGTRAWVFVPEASFQESIKTYGAFMKETKKQETNPIAGGATEAHLLTEKEVLALADLPTKKEMIEKIARLIKGIPTKLARSINATPHKLAYAIKLATLDGKEGAEEALAAARAAAKAQSAE